MAVASTTQLLAPVESSFFQGSPWVPGNVDVTGGRLVLVLVSMVGGSASAVSVGGNACTLIEGGTTTGDGTDAYAGVWGYVPGSTASSQAVSITHADGFKVYCSVRETQGQHGTYLVSGSDAIAGSVPLSTLTVAVPDMADTTNNLRCAFAFYGIISGSTPTATVNSPWSEALDFGSDDTFVVGMYFTEGRTNTDAIVTPDQTADRCAAIVAFELASAATGNELDVTAAELEITSHSVGLHRAYSLAVTGAEAEASSPSVTLTHARALTVTTGDVEATSPSVTLALSRLLQVTEQAIEVTSHAANLSRQLEVTGAELEITSDTVNLDIIRHLAVTTADVEADSPSVTLTQQGDGILVVTPADIAVTSPAASLFAAKVLGVTGAEIVATTPNIALVLDFILEVTGVSVLVEAHDVALDSTNALSVQTAAVALTTPGQQLLRQLILHATSGGIEVDGPSVELYRSQLLTALSQAVAVTSPSVGLRAHRRLSVTHAIVWATSHDVELAAVVVEFPELSPDTTDAFPIAPTGRMRASNGTSIRAGATRAS